MLLINDFSDNHNTNARAFLIMIGMSGDPFETHCIVCWSNIKIILCVMPMCLNEMFLLFLKEFCFADYASISLPLFENYDIVEQPADLIQLGDHYGNKSAEFLKMAKSSNKPFFLYVAFAHMHVPLAHEQR